MLSLAQCSGADFGSFFESLTGFTLPKYQTVVEQSFSFASMAERAGVYFLLKNGRIVYIGQSITPEARIINHAREKDFDSFYIIRCRPELLNTAESLLIIHFQPPLNGNVTTPPEGVCLKYQAKSILRQSYGLSMHSFNKWRKAGLIQVVARHRGQEFFWTHEIIRCAETESGILSA